VANPKALLFFLALLTQCHATRRILQSCTQMLEFSRRHAMVPDMFLHSLFPHTDTVGSRNGGACRPKDLRLRKMKPAARSLSRASVVWAVQTLVLNSIALAAVDDKGERHEVVVAIAVCGSVSDRGLKRRKPRLRAGHVPRR